MSTTDETPAFPYALCQDCELEFADRDAMGAHLAETVASSPDRRSHRARVVNPTPDEVAASQIDAEIALVIEECMYSLERLIDRGTATKGQIDAALTSYPDFQDAWSEHVKEYDL